MPLPTLSNVISKPLSVLTEGKNFIFLLIFTVGGTYGFCDELVGLTELNSWFFQTGHLPCKLVISHEKKILSFSKNGYELFLNLCTLNNPKLS